MQQDLIDFHMLASFDWAIPFGSAAEIVEAFLLEADGDPVTLLRALKRVRPAAFNAVLCSRFGVAAYAHSEVCGDECAEAPMDNGPWFLSILVDGELEATAGQLDSTYPSRAHAEAAAVGLFDLEKRFMSDLAI